MMKSLKGLTLLLMFSIFSIVLAPTSSEAGTMASLGTSVSYSLDTAGRNYEADVPVTLRGGYRFKAADLYAEVSIFSTKESGTEMVGVASRNLEFLLWARKTFSFTKRLGVFGALGFGAHQETVATKYNGDTYRDEGQTEAVVAAAGGLRWRLSKIFEASLEARVSGAESYSPNPRFGLGAFIGFAL